MVIHDNQDEQILFYNAVQGFNNVNDPHLFKACSVNLSSNTKIWEFGPFSDSLNNAGLAYFQPILFDGGVIYGCGSFLYCNDSKSGLLKWKTFVANAMDEIKIYNGKLTCLDNNGKLYLIDAATGAVLKTSQLKSGNTKQWQMHNGVIYFTVAAHTLYAIDADTHEIKWEAKSPNPNCGYCTFGFASPVVDAETNRLYISDRKEIICYELPW